MRKISACQVYFLLQRFKEAEGIEYLKSIIYRIYESYKCTAKQI